MNTPNNAGKEHNPDGLTPEQYGAPEWRLLTTEETQREVDEWLSIYSGDWQKCCNHEFGKKYKTITYRRRTAPPTQSQEGETPETDAVAMDSWSPDVVLAPLEFTKSLELRLTAAQRENDRLRSEVAVLDEIMKGERIVTPVNKEHATWMYRTAFDYLNAARAATEEGKRG